MSIFYKSNSVDGEDCTKVGFLCSSGLLRSKKKRIKYETYLLGERVSEPPFSGAMYELYEFLSLLRSFLALKIIRLRFKMIINAVYDK